MADLEAGAEEPMRRFGHATGAVRWGWLLALLVPLLLAGCASWTNPTKPATAFADDAAACKAEATQAREPPGRSTSIKTTSIPPACTARAGSCGSAPSPASLFLWPDLRRSPCRAGGALPGRFPTSVRHRVPRALSPCSGQGGKHAPQRRRTHPRLRA